MDLTRQKHFPAPDLQAEQGRSRQGPRLLKRVEDEIAKLRSDLPDTLKLKEAELTAEQRRLANQS
jgi:hypothetical protein